MSAKHKTFYVGVKSVVVNPTLEKALILLTTDPEGTRHWDVPGGRIDDQEAVEETLRRELKEEVLNIGEEFKGIKLLNVYWLSKDYDGHGLVLLFHKVESSIEKVEPSPEHDDYRWVGVNALYQLKESKEPYIESGYLQALELALFKV